MNARRSSLFRRPAAIAVVAALAAPAACGSGDVPADATAATSSSGGAGASSSASSASSGGGGHPGACTGADGQPTDCSELADDCHDAHCDAALDACVITDADRACDDHDPCTDHDACLVGTCIGEPIAGCCTPSCAGKACGDDNCGGTCGACAPGEVCAAGACVPPPVESDTCANAPSITLPYSHAGSTIGLTNDYAAPQHACGQAADLGVFAPDAVYRYHATKDGVIAVALTQASFDAGVYVVTDCANPKYTCEVGVDALGAQLGPIYAPVIAGQDYFIVVDGDGVDAGTYQLDVTDCVPQCQGKACGSDGCGGRCGDCQPKFFGVCSSQGTCACLPDCNGKACGPDGCGGSCGACSVGLACDGSGQCVAPNQSGDSCANAIAVDTFPFVFSGTTVGFGNDATAWWACQGNGINGYLGIDAPDRVFAVHPAVTTTYHFEVTQASMLSSLYVVTDCADILSCVEAGYEAFTLREQVVFEVAANRTAYVVVDGNSNESGTFTLIGERCDAPGACSAGEPGEFCSTAILAPSLPFAAQGTVGALDSYHLEPGGSCNVPKRVGEGSQDVAYAFVAPQDGTYEVVVTPSAGDPVVVVATDCTALDTQCVAWADQGGVGAPETVTFSGVAGTTYYVIIDAFTVVSASFAISIDGPP